MKKRPTGMHNYKATVQIWLAATRNCNGFHKFFYLNSYNIILKTPYLRWDNLGAAQWYIKLQPSDEYSIYQINIFFF